MAMFKVVKGHDAWVKYATLVEADTQTEAEEVAMSRSYDGKWVDIGDVSEYDHYDLMEDETEKVDSDYQLSEVTAYCLTIEEFSTVLAGLRALQALMTMTAGELPNELPNDIQDILTNGGQLPGLNEDAIDRLCEELNH